MKFPIIASTFFVLAAAASFPASAGERSVELILDASGSMNGKLTNGDRKIDAAKSAVAAMTRDFPKDVSLSFRAYGHQSHRKKKDCKDTALMIPFGQAGVNADQISATAQGLDAQGYTPITLVLGLAADDLKGRPGKRTIVLVSDGKETCEGDPCLLAAKLAAADPDLVIHTVGFGVDQTTRSQLQCIARRARGKYFDAESADQLAKSMVEAVQEKETVTLKLKKKKGPGRIEVINGNYHRVLDAETGESVELITDHKGDSVEVPAGIYNVTFGDHLTIKSVEVEPEKTTTITPGLLTIANHDYHHIQDAETGQNYMTYYGETTEMALPAGRYNVTFDDAIWHNVEISEGETTNLTPGLLKVSPYGYHKVLDETGKSIATYYGPDRKQMPLPPGSYRVMFDDAAWPIEIKAGEDSAISPGGIEVAPGTYFKIFGADGKHLATRYKSDAKALLPPGEYTIEIEGYEDQKTPIEIAGGKFLKIELE